jgi:predicted glycosyltransferase
MMDQDFSKVEANGRDLARVKEERRRKLMEAFQQFRPDAFIIELFPFGRKYFQFELLPVLEHNLEQPQKALVVCSLRDILVEKDDQDSYEQRVLKWLHRYFDLLLVHSDPSLVRLEDTFSRVEQIGIPLHYTGYVARLRDRSAPIPSGRTRKLIVASSGGGKVGADLLQSAIIAVTQSEDQELALKVFSGPFLEPSDQKTLERLADRDPRVKLFPFSPSFPEHLAMAELSVSMAGYNTTMDLLVSGTKAIVYPFPQNREQAMRAHRLEAMGLVRVLAEPKAELLKTLIEEALDRTSENTPIQRLDLEGASRSARIVEKYLHTDYARST